MSIDSLRLVANFLTVFLFEVILHFPSDDLCLDGRQSDGMAGLKQSTHGQTCVDTSVQDVQENICFQTSDVSQE